MTTENFVTSFQTLKPENVKSWVKELLYSTLSFSLIGSDQLKTSDDFASLITNFKEEKSMYAERKKELQDIMASEEKAQKYAEEERADILKQQHTYREEKIKYLESFRTKVDIIKSMLTDDESNKINIFLKGLIEDLEEIYKQQDDIALLDGQIEDTEAKEASTSFNESISLIDMSMDICDKNIANVENVLNLLKEVDERMTDNEDTESAASSNANA